MEDDNNKKMEDDKKNSKWKINYKITKFGCGTAPGNLV